jgi:hypothetical protein
MSKPAVNLSWLASRSGPVTDQQLKQIQEWLDADWESHDVERDAVRLIGRLVATLDEERKPERERDARYDDAAARRPKP